MPSVYVTEKAPSFKNSCTLSFKRTNSLVVDHKLLKNSVLTKEELEKDYPDVDYRLLPFTGTWNDANSTNKNEFFKDDIDDPHVKRKIAILARYPEIRNLYGPDESTQYITLICVITQLLSTYIFTKLLNLPYKILIILAYIVGASISQIIGIIFHEISHQLLSNKPVVNKLYSIIGNIIIPLPIGISFCKYHLDHHAYQGVEGKDPDLPLEFEKWLVSNRWYFKIAWIFIYPMLYVLRGAVYAKKFTYWELLNWLCTLSTDACIFFTCGSKGLAYLVLSMWFGFGIHPVAAHFIQEHYVFTQGQETYSYYGWWNKLFLNIGYHNEHHDFQKIAWSRLPAVRRIAGEFYNCLDAHYSWLGVFARFIFDDGMGPSARAVRDRECQRKGRKMIKVSI